VYDDDDGPAHCDDDDEEQLDDATTNAWSQNEAARNVFLNAGGKGQKLHRSTRDGEDA
jgi:L-2-hydroxyglutarate oxidase LhgO